MQMPDEDGVHLGLRIQANPLLRGLPVILLTSSGEGLEEEQARRAGIRRVLFKPVRQSSLLDAILTSLVGEDIRQTARALTTPHTEAEPVAKATEEPRRKGRLLVAEDNPVNQRLALKLLEKLGYEVELAANGREAVEKALRGGWDAILMDCQMPEVDGYEATGVIRSREPADVHVPIIAMTANAMKGDRERCLDAGMDDYLSKPVNRGELEAVLGRWVVQIRDCA
jgi:CheY-like chemotaxis protein